MNEHTQGPWTRIVHEAVGGGDYIQILAGSWDIAHNRFSARDWQEELANANLIAAAPDLLAACQALIAGYRKDGWSGMTRELNPMEDAITKATTGANHETEKTT